MENCIIMCRSVTYAQRAQKLLERSGISAYINKAPQTLSVEGCSYGVKVARKNLSRSLEILRRGGVKTGKVFSIGDDGGYLELGI